MCVYHLSATFLMWLYRKASIVSCTRVSKPSCFDVHT